MAALPYIVGNWKMNGTRAMLNELRAIDRAAGRLPRVQVAIAPPATLVFRARDAVDLIGIGGQDCHALESGAFTGDISAVMLRDAGADFTIVGHSERRSLHGEGDGDVKAKAEAALAANLGVIVCVGESLEDREAGRALDFVTRQLAASLPRGDISLEKVSVAYEPVWAIGTGKVCDVADVAEMHAALRATLQETYGDAGADVRILYGGSVKAENAAQLLATEEVGGALVGGASLTAESFLSIVGAAAALQD